MTNTGQSDWDQFIAHGELWREAWRSILRTQLSAAESFHVLYQPIGTDENVKHITAVTPEGPLTKVAYLESTYSELRSELGGEITSIDSKLLKPAADARDSLRMLKKVIKKRDDFKVRLTACALDCHTLSSKARL